MTTATTRLTLSEVGNHQQDGTPTPAGRPHDACEHHPLPVSRRLGLGFWANVLKTDCCWLWTRARFAGTRYGMVWRAGKLYKAHRVAYEEQVGPILAGLDLMHSCDVRHCVRPDHLRPGTRKENQQDMVRKRRNARQDGEHNHYAKLTAERVAVAHQLHRDGWTHREIADHFGVTRGCITDALSGRNWGRVDVVDVEPVA